MKMSLNYIPCVQQNDEQMVEDEFYHREVFVLVKCHKLNDRLALKNITRIREIV